MSSVKFSELVETNQLGDADVLAVSVADTTQTPTTYTSFKATMLTIANRIVAGITFSNKLDTTDKTVCGAINEVRGLVLTDTLTAGSTTLTFSNQAITTNSTVDIYTDAFGVNPTNVVVATGSVTLTFSSQASNLGVKVRIT